jgi:hypothetical protein
MFCLLSLSIGIARLESATSRTADVAVYLKSDGSGSPAGVANMMRELGELMLSAGFQIEWGDWKKPSVGLESADLAVVVLRGTCSAPSSVEPTEQIKHMQVLASTAVSDHKILPFSWVDCTALSQFLGPSMAHESTLRRDYVYGRAMARLAGHELYHILARTGEHTQAGIAKERFAIADLLAEHFQYESEALLRMHSAQSAEIVLEPAIPGSSALRNDGASHPGVDLLAGEGH